MAGTSARYVTGPFIDYPLDRATRRRSKVGRPVIGFTVGKRDTVNLAELDEKELITIIGKAAEALDYLRGNRKLAEAAADKAAEATAHLRLNGQEGS